MNFDATVQTIGWFRDRYREGTLIIKPPYQRKPVWTQKQKCYLIESILLQLPVPEVYIQHAIMSKDEDKDELRDEFGVVDGQQRIRTILQFIGLEADPDEAEFNGFTLDKLPSTSAWQNASFKTLTDDVKRQFVGYRLSVRLLNTEREEDVRDMFRRLNKFLTPLNYQELRNATYSGPFSKVANELANDRFWAENGLVSPLTIRRMKDIEFVSELLIGVLHGPQGGSGGIVDDYYAIYEDFDEEFPDQQRALSLFTDTLNLIKRALVSLKDLRWDNRSDFYTLFVGIASLLKTHNFEDMNLPKLREALITFSNEVSLSISNKQETQDANIISYINAVTRGVNDKARRAERQRILVSRVEELFTPRSTVR